jgi:hypothetical protein
MHDLVSLAGLQVQPDPEFPTVKYPNPEEVFALVLVEIRHA